MRAGKLTGDARLPAFRNMAVCFHGTYDENEARRELQETLEGKCDYYGAFPEGEQDAVASLVMHHFTAEFEGQPVQAGGIGGVATLPAFRRQGAVRAMMRTSHEDLFRSGALFSLLYPFSLAYYKQYGFAPGPVSHLWTVPVEELQGIKDPGGRIRQIFPGEDDGVLLEVYRRVNRGVNLSIHRDVFSEEMRRESSINQKRYVFVYENGQGEPAGLMVGHLEDGVLHCETDFTHRGMLLCDSTGTLLALLRFVHRAYLTHYSAVSFTLDEGADLYSLLPGVTNSGKATCQAVYNGMIRAVCVQEALKRTRCLGRGKLCIGIRDPLIDENNGVFRLTYQEGEPNRVERTDDAPDLVMGPGSLAQLLTGCRSAEQLPWLSDVEIRTDADTAGVFRQKPCGFLNLF